jgi:hypothetical protein
MSLSLSSSMATTSSISTSFLFRKFWITKQPKTLQFGGSGAARRPVTEDVAVVDQLVQAALDRNDFDRAYVVQDADPIQRVLQLENQVDDALLPDVDPVGPSAPEETAAGPAAAGAAMAAGALVPARITPAVTMVATGAFKAMLIPLCVNVKVLGERPE